MLGALALALICLAPCARAVEAGLADSPLPLPALERSRGLHPRLFVDAAGAERLRAAIAGTSSAAWKNFVREADLLVDQRPGVYKPAETGEQLWQRSVGNGIATLAFAWLVSRDPRYLAGATAWARASCSYPTWGKDAKTGKSFDKGLACGHQQLGLSMLYDFAHAELSPADRALIRTALVEHTRRQYVALRDDYAALQNHSWINATGMLAAGLALFDEEEEAPAWIRLPWAIFDRSTAMLAPDGASQEGPGYWQYGLEHLLKLDALLTGAGRTRTASPWWRNTATYGLHLMTPRHGWSDRQSLVDFSDSARSSWYGPGYLFRALAARNRDGVAQWLADTVEASPVEAAEAPWLDVLWYDPTVRPASPIGQPTLHHFTDLGIVAARSDWSGDEALVVFKAGNPIGATAATRFRADLDPRDIGHVHRDANHFCLYGGGQWLIRNPGYGLRDAAFHNTLTIDDRGQTGDDGLRNWWPTDTTRWFARIVSATSGPTADRIVGDAGDAYPSTLGVTRFVRRLVFLKPDVLIVADDIRLDASRRMDLWFHTENRPEELPDGAFRMEGRSLSMRIEQLTHAGTAAIELQTMTGKHAPADPDRPVVRLSRTATAWRNAVAFSWAASPRPPPRVALSIDGTTWRFTVDRRTAQITWDDGK